MKWELGANGSETDRRILWLPGALLAGLFLSACAAASVTSRASTMDAESVARVLVTPTTTATLPLTAIASPTATRLRATPTRTPTAWPTPALVVQVRNGTPTAFHRRESSSVSPNGQWIAVMVAAFGADGGGEEYYTALTVRRNDGSFERTIVDEWAPLGLGYTLPTALTWSRDGQRLYFTNRPVPDGCGVFVNGSDLYRVNLTNGQVTEVAPRVGLWIALSPDESRLAYKGYGSRGLVVRDLASGVEREAALIAGSEDWDGIRINWSPDGSALLLTLAHHHCDPSERWVRSFVRVNAATLSQRMLLRNDRRLLTVVAWPITDKVFVEDKDGNFWWLDARTGRLTQP